MAHPPASTPTTTQSNLGTNPNLTLQRALESLMVNLDDELIRYRQSRSGQEISPPSRAPLKFRPKTSRSSPSLIHLKSAPPVRSAVAGRSEPQAPTAVTPPLHQGQAPFPTAAMPPTHGPSFPADQPMGSTLMPYQASPEDYLESTEALLSSTPRFQETDQNFDEMDDYQPSLARQLATPLGIGALLLLLVGSAGFGYLITSPEAVEHLREHALLQRFQPAPTVDQPLAVGAPNSQASPVPTGLQGLGPDLSEQEFGSLDLDRISSLPSSPPARSDSDFGSRPDQVQPNSTDRQPLPADAIAGDRTPTTAMRAETMAPLPSSRPNGTAAVPSVATPISPQPTPSRPTPTATTSPAAVAPQAPLRVAPPAINAQPPQPLVVNPTPTPVQPPAPLSPSSAPSAPASTSPSYYVITEYTGNQSLESARGAVGDAYVRDFPNGTKIQMGAFSQASSAQNLVQQLQQQGIPAQVYAP
jgi:hypothetical protein